MANPYDELNKLKQPQQGGGDLWAGGAPAGGDPKGQLGAFGGQPAGNTGAAGAPAGGASPAGPAATTQPVGGGLEGTQPMGQGPIGGGLEGTQPVGQMQPATQPNPMDPNAVWGNLQNQFQTKFNRAMSPEEAQALQQYAGYTGGAINQGMIDKATQGIGAYTGDLSNPFGPAAGTQPGTTQPSTNDVAQQELQKLLLTGNTDAMQLNMDNPAIRAQRANFGRVNDRATMRQRLASAERSAGDNSLGSGGFSADMAAAEQAGGDRAAQFESQLMTQELQSQRDRVMNAMQMAVQSGDQQQARALQEKLGTLDMNLRERLGKGQLGLGLLGTMLSDRRAGDQLGLGYAQLGQRANESLLNSILGGL